MMQIPYTGVPEIAVLKISFNRRNIDVVVAGRPVKSFDLMSDDYAYTNARAYADKINKEANDE